MVSIELELRTHELVQSLRWGAFFSDKLAPYVCIYPLNQYTTVWQALENQFRNKRDMHGIYILQKHTQKKTGKNKLKREGQIQSYEYSEDNKVLGGRVGVGYPFLWAKGQGKSSLRRGGGDM